MRTKEPALPVPCWPFLVCECGEEVPPATLRAGPILCPLQHLEEQPGKQSRDGPGGGDTCKPALRVCAPHLNNAGELGQVAWIQIWQDDQLSHHPGSDLELGVGPLLHVSHL